MADKDVDFLWHASGEVFCHCLVAQQCDRCAACINRAANNEVAFCYEKTSAHRFKAVCFTR
jgi:hypothetical protein